MRSPTNGGMPTRPDAHPVIDTPRSLLMSASSPSPTSAETHAAAPPNTGRQSELPTGEVTHSASVSQVRTQRNNRSCGGTSPPLESRHSSPGSLHMPPSPQRQPSSPSGQGDAPASDASGKPLSG